MWSILARFILKRRLLLLSAVLVFTALMAYKATQVEFSYEFAKILPDGHPELDDLAFFNATFGEDANIFVIGFQSNDLFNNEVLGRWHELGQRIEEVDGVIQVLSMTHCFQLEKDTAEKRFDLVPLLSKNEKVDGTLIKQKIERLPFYQELLYEPESKATLMAIAIDELVMDGPQRIRSINTIKELGMGFEQSSGIELRYSGLPFLRTFRATTIAKELIRFLIAAGLITVLILYLLFRSWRTVFFPLAVVLAGVFSTMGTVVLLGYELTMLTGIIPTLIVVIGVPNCVYLINKYQQLYVRSGQKMAALEETIATIGQVTFFANLTTAIGFGVFTFMGSDILKEFGIVASLNIAITYVISLIVITALCSYFPPPQEKHTRHLKRRAMKTALSRVHQIVVNQPRSVVAAFGVLVLVSLVGLGFLEAKGYLFDDVSARSKEYKDLKFFEKHFKGVMPFEVIVDTKKKNSVSKLSFLKRLDRAHQVFEKDSLFSKPVSLLNGIKFANQAFFNGGSSYYSLPTNLEKNFVFQYIGKTGNKDNKLFTSLTDSTGRLARISVQMADVGSSEFPKVIERIKPEIEKHFSPEKYDLTYTGTSLVALSGYNYLVEGLISSVLLAFFLIAVIIAYLFRSVRMLVIALLPNMIPLLFTAAVMGYSGISLKPSTVLIFSVAFGISVDFTIHFLAKLRLELGHGTTLNDSISKTISETGFSMIYTAIILFLGFVVFTFSTFQGTIYLGFLTSITLVVALATNLLLLPVIIMKVHQNGRSFLYEF